MTLAFPKDVNELIQKLDHNYLAYFDNVSRIPEWISDQFCRAVTGSGFSKRQLYTDDDDIIYSFMRALGFNGINLAATKADLLDRCLIILLETIREDKREPLQDIVNIKGLNQELERIKPQILGYIFDILVKMLKVITTSGIERPKELPRMADFALHGEIVARSIGYDRNVFLDAFNENIRLQSDELLESNPLAMAIFQFVEWEPSHEFSGTATLLLSKLNIKAAELGIETDKFWPKGPGALSRRLNLIRTSLRRIGIDIEFYSHQENNIKSRGIKVRKISCISSVSSVTSDIDPNQARIHADGANDTLNDMNDTGKISYKEPEEIHAQNEPVSLATDDMHDTDDIFQTFGSQSEENRTEIENSSAESNNRLEECKRRISRSEFAPIIGVKQEGPNGKSLPRYYCRLHHYPPDKRVGTREINTKTIHFDVIEAHCRNVEPERHKAELSRLSSLGNGAASSSSNNYLKPLDVGGSSIIVKQRSQLLQRNNNFLHSELPVCYPFVKWAGGKTQLLSKLDSFIPAQVSRYFEPFLGGGALFFHLITHKKKPIIISCISDINAELINAYLVIRDTVEELIVQLDQHQTKYKEGPKEEYYYQLRGIDPNTLNDVERAARFITLNKTCYNGLYRVNGYGLFNVPWGKRFDPTICDSRNLRNVNVVLNNSNAKIEASDYKGILLENAKAGDFIYLDPPYNPASSTAYFTSYTHTGFNDKNQKELAAVFRELTDRGCKVLLSNSDTQFIRDLYSDYAEYTVEVNDVMRAISSKGSKRTGHKELIIRNYPN